MWIKSCVCSPERAENCVMVVWPAQVVLVLRNRQCLHHVVFLPGFGANVTVQFEFASFLLPGEDFADLSKARRGKGRRDLEGKRSLFRG